MKKVYAGVLSVLLMLVPAVALAHGTGSITSFKPNEASNLVYARADYNNTLSHPNGYKVNVWLQRRLPGGSWSSVDFFGCNNDADGNCATFPGDGGGAYNCRYDYRSISEGWSIGDTGSLHQYAQDLTSPILFHTC